MKHFASLLALATTAFATVLLKDFNTNEALNVAFGKLEASQGKVPSEYRELWEEMARDYPEDTLNALQNMMTGSKPKAHKKRDDSEWDYVIEGKDIQMMVQEEGKKMLDGNFDNKRLRIKKPVDLGVDDVKQYSGYLDVDDDKHFFFWFFESRNDPANDPVLLWLNGGPGCSSLLGLFMELGPSMLNKKLEPVYNKFGWNANASTIFLDQPVNVGYSYSSSGVTSTAAAAEDVYAFLSLFFAKFPQYAKQDFHIAGESYGGHYVPKFAAEIMKHKNRNINLKSVAIGNGLTDGLTQYEYYGPMACGEGGYPAVLDQGTCDSMAGSVPRCTGLIKSCYNSGSTWVCVPASIYCNNVMIGPYQRTGKNVYDIREDCKGSSGLCYDEIEWIGSYLNQDKVRSAVGAEVTSYDSCNMDINRNFLMNGDWMLPFHTYITELLEAGVPVLIYAGDADYICNWLGNKAWTERLEWKGQKDYAGLKMSDYTIEGKKYGEFKEAGNFTFLRLFQGGHMIPYDQPLASLSMINRWLAGYSVADKESKDAVEEGSRRDL